MSDHDSAIRGLPRWHPSPHVRSAIETIRRSGWQVTAVSDTCSCASPTCLPPECAFAYTAGLVLHDVPELVVYGLAPRSAIAVLNELAVLLHHQDWQTIVADRSVLTVASLRAPIRLIEVIDKDDMLMANLLFPDSPALQVVWPDDLGHYPWDAGYTLLPMHQPTMGVEDTIAARVRGPRVITGDQVRRRRMPRSG